MATSKNYGKKRFGSLPGYFEPLWEKSNYGKIGRRRRLSKLNVVFFIILSVTIYISTYRFPCHLFTANQPVFIPPWPQPWMPARPGKHLRTSKTPDPEKWVPWKTVPRNPCGKHHVPSYKCNSCGHILFSDRPMRSFLKNFKQFRHRIMLFSRW